MKKYLLGVLLLILLLNNLFGEIKNGYEKDIPGLKRSLQSLRALLEGGEHLTASSKKRIREKINFLINHLTYYELTNRLLAQFRTIAPDLYYELDTIEDSSGNGIDIYVKFIPGDEPKALLSGIAAFESAGDDLTTCRSEYGERSVSVKVCVLSRALWILAHEFGHVKYLVPNLRSYVQYYKKRYRRGQSDLRLGHLPGDPSGKMAMAFEDRFRESYFRHLKAQSAPLSPMALVNPIKRNLLLDMND